MRYVATVLTGMMLCGCGLNGPDCHCPKFDSEMLLLGVDVHGDEMTAMMLDWEHVESEQRSPLDCSCPGPWNRALARRYDTAGSEMWTDDFPREGVYFSGAVQAVQVHGDTTTFAAFDYFWDGRNQGLAPVVVALDAVREVTHFAVLSDHLFGLGYDDYDLSYKQTRIHATTDGAFLFIGPRLGGGTRLCKVSSHGELLWTEDSGGDSVLLNTYYPLANGEYAAISSGSGAKLIGPEGGTLRTLDAHVFGAPYFPYSAANLGDSAIVLAGSVPDQNGYSDAFVYMVGRDGSFIDSFRVPFAGCQDSVHVLYSEWTHDLVLVCRNRPLCGDAVMIQVFRVTIGGGFIAQTGLSHFDRTYLTGAESLVNGGVLIAATTNSGREDGLHYGKLIALNADLTLSWDKTIGPQ